MPAVESSYEARSLIVTDRTDRALGAAVHVSSVFWPLLGPLVGWALFRKSKPFVTAHAKQALFETVFLNVALLLALVASTTYTVFRIVHFVQTNWVDFNLAEFIVRFLVGWIALAVLQFANTVFSVFQAWKAWKGTWPRSASKG
jgi:uncharacterized Tic20 family protein